MAISSARRRRKMGILGAASRSRWWDAGWRMIFQQPEHMGPPMLTAKHRMEKGSCLVVPLQASISSVPSQRGLGSVLGSLGDLGEETLALVGRSDLSGLAAPY